VSKLAAAPEVMIFFHMRALDRPSADEEQRYHVSRLGIPNCYRLVLRHGFNDQVITEDLASVIYEQVRAYIATGPAPRVAASHSDDEDHDIHRPVIIDGQPVVDVPSSTTSSSDAKPSNKAMPSIAEAEAQRTADLARLDAAFSHQVLYVIGKEELKVKKGTWLGRAVLLKAFLWMRENSRTKVADLRVPTERVVEVGFVKEV